MNLFDALRAKYPHLGLALYAYEPDGAVTFECHTPSGDVFPFTGPTAEAAMLLAFPEDAPAAEPKPEPTITTNVFE